MRALLLAGLVAGCVGSPEIGDVSEAVGEVDSGYPTPWERALFMSANRARSDPSTVKGSGSNLPAQAPLVFHKDLGPLGALSRGQPRDRQGAAHAPSRRAR